MGGLDSCVSVRKTYVAILSLLTSNNIITSVVSFVPILYILSYTIYNVTNTPAYLFSTYLTGSGFSIFGVLFASWLIGLFSIWKTMPNLLTVSIFVYKCLGHWALVTFTIVIFYFSQYFVSSVTGNLSLGLLPSVGLLLFAADILRTKRTKMYGLLQSRVADSITATINESAV